MGVNELNGFDLLITDKSGDEIPTQEFINLVGKRAPYYRAIVTRISPLEVRIEGQNKRLARFMVKILKMPSWLQKVAHLKSRSSGP
jgi:hypothetical protein